MDSRKVMHDLLSYAERQICTHEETHRGGVLWEICDNCGAKWADDRGGKPEFRWPVAIVQAREFLDSPEPRPQPDNKEGEGVEWEPGVDLPPVGVWVDLVNEDEHVEVMCHGKGTKFCGRDKDGYIGIFDADFAEPIPDPRTKVIEAATEVGASQTPVLDSHVRAVVDALAEADMLKLPGEEG